MSKTSLIVEREYLSRVRKKSFIIMTFIGPLLMAGLMVVPAWLSIKNMDIQIVQVIDETHAFKNEIPNTKTLKFEFNDRDIVEAKEEFYNEEYTAILYIPSNGYVAPNAMRLFYKKQPSANTLSYLNQRLSDIFESDKLRKEFNISKNELEKIKTDVDVLTISIDEQGKEEETFTKTRTLIGIASAIMIYFFIFLYGVQIMRGVIEEKTSKIVEVIISSVKPFQLMLGKIIGIALVGLTQFILWIVLTTSIIFVIKASLPESMFNNKNVETEMEAFMPPSSSQAAKMNQNDLMGEVTKSLKATNFTLILACFLFYFLGGYLLYGALFAAIGSAVDSESDTQQFMLPITIPLIGSFMIAQIVTQNPDGALSFWTSIIPFTSPIIMMVRIPFGVDTWELLLSMFVLIISFIGTTWVAARIYRTGILMHGKKVNYKELWKWLFYKV